jgi:hypothetical protein
MASSPTPVDTDSVTLGVPQYEMDGVGDGSELKGQGTFGWVLALGELILASAFGRAYGDKMDSYRAEGYGLLSLVTYVHHLFQFFNTPVPAHLHLTLYSDNKALITKILKLLNLPRPVFPNETLQPSYDVVQAIVTKCRGLKGVGADWVKGHRDRVVSTAALTRQERLNVKADKLAGDFQSQTAHKHRSAPLIGGCKVQLRIKKKTIHSHLRRRVRFTRRATILRERIRRKTGMSAEAFNAVDWDAHRLSCSNYKGRQRFLTQFLHGFLPVGKVVHRYDHVQYLQSCPSCSAPIEDQIHWLRCPDPERQKWQSDLRAQVRKLWSINRDEPHLSDILEAGLYHWLRGEPFPAHQFPHHHLQQLITSQEAIGWGQLLYGRFSEHWNLVQYNHLRATGRVVDHRSQGSAWLMRFIHTIWNRVQEEWDTRNKARHGVSQEDQAEKRLESLKRRIVHLYTFKDRCLPHDSQRIFYDSAEVHFEKHSGYTHLHNWYVTHSQLVYASSQTMEGNQNNGQRLLTDYFECRIRGGGVAQDHRRSRVISPSQARRGSV